MYGKEVYDHRRKAEELEAKAADYRQSERILHKQVEAINTGHSFDTPQAKAYEQLGNLGKAEMYAKIARNAKKEAKKKEKMKLGKTK